MSLDAYPVKAEDFDGPGAGDRRGRLHRRLGSGASGAGGRARWWRSIFPTTSGGRSPADDRYRRWKRSTWETGDIADSERVMSVVRDHDVRAIIHLAALQVPFCKADPINGAKVNVVGTVNMFEAARARNNLKRVAFASSIAAHSFFPDQSWLPTLYGAYKYCDEMIAQVYCQDWGVPSVGLRPGVVYGIGRDQGHDLEDHDRDPRRRRRASPTRSRSRAPSPACMPARWRARSSRLSRRIGTRP